MISSPMPMAMLLLLTAKGTDGFTILIGNKLPLYQLLLFIGTAILVSVINKAEGLLCYVLFSPKIIDSYTCSYRDYKTT